MTSLKINSCPSCDSEAHVFSPYSSCTSWWVLCNNCDLCGPGHDSQDGAIENWNRIGQVQYQKGREDGYRAGNYLHALAGTVRDELEKWTRDQHEEEGQQ